MKKIAILIILGLATISNAMASSWTEKVKLVGSQNEGTFAINASSVTATLARPANTKRTKLEINNISAFVIYKATYAATSSTELFDISSTTIYTDNISPYTGAVYILLQAGQSAQSIKILETWID